MIQERNCNFNTFDSKECRSDESSVHAIRDKIGMDIAELKKAFIPGLGKGSGSLTDPGALATRGNRFLLEQD